MNKKIRFSDVIINNELSNIVKELEQSGMNIYIAFYNHYCNLLKFKEALNNNELQLPTTDIKYLKKFVSWSLPCCYLDNSSHIRFLLKMEIEELINIVNKIYNEET